MSAALCKDTVHQHTEKRQQANMAATRTSEARRETLLQMVVK